LPPDRRRDVVTFGYLLDASHEAVLYAIKSGRVASDVIAVETHALEIPGLIEATSARRFDVVETGTLAVPRILAQGLDLVILSTAQRFRRDTHDDDIWVMSGSSIRHPADLRGKTLGVAAIDSTGAALARFALWKKYGLDVRPGSSEVRFIARPPAALMAALAAGEIDAVAQIQAQTYRGVKTGALRSVAQVGNDLHDLYGVYMVPAVNTTYRDKVAARPRALQEFSRLLKASADYAIEHLDEVATAAAKDTGEEPGYFRWWAERDAEFPATINGQDLKAIAKTWELAQELGLLRGYPDPAGLVWEHAPRG